MSGPEVCEQLTLYPEDSPASRFPWPESSAGKRTSGFCGLKCSALSGSLGRIASSVRTCLESSRLPPGRWSRRALGNAVVPQQAYPIFRALAEELNRRNDDGY